MRLRKKKRSLKFMPLIDCISARLGSGTSTTFFSFKQFEPFPPKMALVCPPLLAFITFTLFFIFQILGKIKQQN